MSIVRNGNTEAYPAAPVKISRLRIPTFDGEKIMWGKPKIEVPGTTFLTDRSEIGFRLFETDTELTLLPSMQRPHDLHSLGVTTRTLRHPNNMNNFLLANFQLREDILEWIQSDENMETMLWVMELSKTGSAEIEKYAQYCQYMKDEQGRKAGETRARREQHETNTTAKMRELVSKYNGNGTR